MMDRFDQESGQTWESLFGEEALAGVQEAEPPESGLIPRGDFYGLLFEKSEVRVGKKSGLPRAHFTIRVKRGPAGTENRVLFDDFFFTLPEAGDPEYRQRLQRLQGTLVRLRNHLKLERISPSNPNDPASVEAWAKQFEGKECVGAIMIQRARKDESGQEFEAANRIVWASVSAYSAYPVDKKTGKPGPETYEEVQRKWLEKQTKGPGSTPAARPATAGTRPGFGG